MANQEGITLEGLARVVKDMLSRQDEQASLISQGFAKVEATTGAGNVIMLPNPVLLASGTTGNVLTPTNLNVVNAGVPANAQAVLLGGNTDTNEDPMWIQIYTPAWTVGYPLSRVKADSTTLAWDSSQGLFKMAGGTISYTVSDDGAGGSGTTNWQAWSIYALGYIG